jgi:phosphoglycolate phosphatase
MKKSLGKNIDSIIFDLDGTLWNATIACTMAWNKAFEQCGYKNNRIDKELIKQLSGSPLNIVLTQYFTFIKEKDYDKIIENYKQNEPIFMRNIGGRLFSNERNTLKILYNYKKLFIVSNCLKGYIENFIFKKKFDTIFTGYKSSGETGLTKGENIKQIIDEYKLRSPIYVGDTKWDYEASKVNNIPFVFAKYGFGKIKNSEYEIKNIKELLEIIK